MHLANDVYTVPASLLVRSAIGWKSSREYINTPAIFSTTEKKNLAFKVVGFSVALTFCLQVNEQKDLPRSMRFRLIPIAV